MNKDETKAIIDQVLADCLVLEEQKIKPEKKISDLGADSLDLVEIVLELESKLAIPIPDEYMERIDTVQDLYDCVHEIQTDEKDESSPRQ